MPFPRVEEIAALVDAILDGGVRAEILALLALLAGRAVVAQERAHELLYQPPPVVPARDLSVAEALREYPVSRSFLYEQGEKLGLAHRTPNGRLIVIERALRAYLEGRS